MCGIVGFTAPGQDPAAAKQIVQGMADLIRHRGPDGEGCYADGTAALGHRRLSVIDLAGGGQPMLNEDGTLVVVFNGEIYNYKTLRARLQQRGHTFATDSDTEVLLHGYEEWGRDLPCRLRGMFAFAVWDRTRGTLFCARDLFGIKPLCYYKKGETLLFASEIKAFLAHPAFEKRLNEARLPDWLSMEYLPDAETLFTGVYELPPAHTLTWQAGRVTLARYAAPRFRAKRGRSLRAWAREIGDAVAESADAHRIADVEVGCFLSGGVDSSLITCEMARRQPAVQCFSVGYAEEAYSELPAARAAAQALGVPLTETTVTEQFIDGTANTVPNAVLEKVAYDNFEALGVVKHSDEEMRLAQAYIDSYEAKADRVPGFASAESPEIAAYAKKMTDNGKLPINDFLMPLHHSMKSGAGSTDVGDVSWQTPTVQVHTACWPSGAPGHSWQNVSCGATSIAEKSMLQAGKVMAGTVIDLLTKPDVLGAAKAEFKEAAAAGYTCPIPPDAVPVAIED